MGWEAFLAHPWMWGVEGPSPAKSCVVALFSVHWLRHHWEFGVDFSFECLLPSAVWHDVQGDMNK